jgi:hypothetical protein
MYYNAIDYKEIVASGFAEKLPAETINIIVDLCAELNVPFHRNKLHDFSVVRRAQPAAASAAQPQQPAFKPTPLFGAKKEGFDKQLNDICVCLNKISAKNVETQYAVILDNVRAIFEKYTFDSTEGQKTIQTILQNCQKNKFYSEIYTQIYIRIAREYPVFAGAVLDENFAAYLDSFKNMKFVDPNVNYDEYCNYNKENEARKSVALFYVNLMKHGGAAGAAAEGGAIFKCERVLACMRALLDYVFLYIDEENRTNEVEEITENINVIFTNLHSYFASGTPAAADATEWDAILEKIQTLSQKKNTSHLSITNRAIFKYMDMIDM